MQFADRLRALRESRGYTQRQLAQRMKLAHGTVANYENGRREPDLATVQRFAEFFGVTLDYMMGRVDDPTALAPVRLPAGAEAKIEQLLEAKGLDPEERQLVLGLIKKLEKK